MLRLDSCKTAKCGPKKQCVVRNGTPKCVCALKCNNRSVNTKHDHKIQSRTRSLHIDPVVAIVQSANASHSHSFRTNNLNNRQRSSQFYSHRLWTDQIRSGFYGHDIPYPPIDSPVMQINTSGKYFN